MEPIDLTCQLCGAEYPTAEEAESCEEMHHMAEEEMGVFDGGLDDHAD